METGENGASGAHALSPVNTESSRENENVTHQLQNMVVRFQTDFRPNYGMLLFLTQLCFDTF